MLHDLVTHPREQGVPGQGEQGAGVEVWVEVLRAWGGGDLGSRVVGHLKQGAKQSQFHIHVYNYITKCKCMYEVSMYL